MADQIIPDHLVEETTTLAFAIAELANKAVGPAALVYRVAVEQKEDGDIIRAAFISRLAEVATQIANDGIDGLNTTQEPKR